MNMPDTIYFNGEMHTFDKDENVYEAIAIKGGKITATGSNESVLGLKSNETRLIDLHNKTVIPGFIDAHIHLFNLGFNLSYVDCRLHSIEDVKKAIKKRAQNCTSKNEWIIGWGFDESYYKEGRKLNKWDFEDIDNPVFIKRYCLHEAVVNEKGLQKAKITNESIFENGIVERNKNGEATGLLIETAMNHVEQALPPYTDDNMKKALQLSTNYLLEKGVTSAHEAGLGFLIDPYKEFNVLKEMYDEGTLHIRMYVMVLGEYYKEFMSKNRFLGSDFLKLGSMKLFADGTLSGKTAAVTKNYKGTEEKGMLLYSDDYFSEYIATAQEMDKQVAVHAIGDRAIDQVLRVLEAHPRKDLRHRIEHTTVSNENILNRMKALHAIPIPQPLLIHVAGDMYDLEEEYLENVFANKNFIDYDLKPAGSSDGPVVDSNPLLGIYAAMTRKTLTGKWIGKNQMIDLKEAIRMYTINAAHAAFEEHIKGSIEVDKFADLTVLPEGFMGYSAEEIKESKVELTIVGGKIMYNKELHEVL